MSQDQSQDQPKCPVDHSTREAWVSKLNQSESANDSKVTESKIEPEQPKCPVDHHARSTWASKVSLSSGGKESITTPTEAIEEATPADGCTSDKLTGEYKPKTNINLPNDREISSIPRTEGNSNWIYPSQKQFFEAMKRKQWNPEVNDMKTVVPIHNAVNERAWSHILQWEHLNYQDAITKCGGIKLTSFKGDSKKLTPRAWFNSTILGYEKPFDRHDWVIDRCGIEIPYVIDFYSGNGKGAGASFYLDVRPKINSWEGIKLRINKAFGFDK